jgi:glutaryl-CoA dehydrogenase
LFQCSGTEGNRVGAEKDAHTCSSERAATTMNGTMMRLAARRPRSVARACAQLSSAAPASAPGAFQWTDPFDLSSQLSDEERQAQASARTYARTKLLPRVVQAFREENFDQRIMAEMGSLGLLGCTLPQEYGGAGLGYVGYGLIAREIEAIDSGYRSAMSVQSSLVMGPIYEFGSEAQKQKYLPELAAGRLIGCFGLTEPGAGSDPGGMKTVARRDGEDYILTGQKSWITNSPIAGVLLVWARVEDEQGAIRGFLIDRSTQGVSTPKILGKLSLRASVTGEIHLDQVRVSRKDAMLPNVKGLKGPFSCLNRARYGISWGSMGAAEFCLDAVRTYSLDRKQFNRPLAHTQLQQLRMADMLSDIALGLQASLRVGRMLEQNACPPEAISIVKRNNCGKALAIARQARDMMGANGISDA